MKEFFTKPPSNIFTLCKKIASRGGRAIIIGGWVRDHLLGLPKNSDVDIEVYHLTYDALKAICLKYYTVEFPHFGIIKTPYADLSLPRLEWRTGPKYNHFAVKLYPNINFRTAALRRDFTINAMGWDPLKAEFFDPYTGINDLKNRLLQPISPKFKEDPYRILRAAQLIARFNFSPTDLLMQYTAHMNYQTISEKFLNKTQILIEHSPYALAAKRFLKKIHWNIF